MATHPRLTPIRHGFAISAKGFFQGIGILPTKGAEVEILITLALSRPQINSAPDADMPNVSRSEC